MHDGMHYDPIQSQGHEPFKVGNPAVFKIYLLRHLQWELATDHGLLNWGTISKFGRAGFLIFGVVFLCHMTLKSAETAVVKSRPSVPYAANLFTVDADDDAQVAGIQVNVWVVMQCVFITSSFIVVSWRTNIFHRLMDVIGI